MFTSWSPSKIQQNFISTNKMQRYKLRSPRDVLTEAEVPEISLRIPNYKKRRMSPLQAIRRLQSPRPAKRRAPPSPPKQPLPVFRRPVRRPVQPVRQRQIAFPQIVALPPSLQRRRAFEDYYLTNTEIKTKCNTLSADLVKSVSAAEATMQNRNRITYSDIEQQISKITGEKYVPLSVLGAGVAGTTFLVCTNNCGYCIALKVQDFTPQIGEEIKMGDRFAKAGVTLPILGDFTYTRGDGQKLSVIVMPVMDFTLTSWLKTRRSPEDLEKLLIEISSIIKNLCANNLVHGDMHFSNMGVYKGKLILIDFGRSAAGPCNIALELLNLLRFTEIDGVIEQHNADYLRHRILKVFKKEYAKIQDYNKPPLYMDAKHPTTGPIVNNQGGREERIFRYLFPIHANKYNIVW